MLQHMPNVVTGLRQPIVLHVPARRTWLPPGPARGCASGCLRLLPISAPCSPKLLLPVQRVQQVVSHDVLPDQVVADSSWKRGQVPAPSACLSSALRQPRSQPCHLSLHPCVACGH